MKSFVPEIHLNGQPREGTLPTSGPECEFPSPASTTLSTRPKCLFVSPVGVAAKENIRKIIARFGHESFDFMLLVYDGSSFEESCFSGCRVIHDGQALFYQLKTHVTPELCRGYEYVFVWMDDLDVLDFDPQKFLRIMREHRIELAQPSLSQDSIISHAIVGHRDTRIGRYTDFVEEMALVFEGRLWERFWTLIRSDENPWGWGYDELAYAYCGFRRMAIIDSEVIRHTRKGGYHEAAYTGRLRLLEELRPFHISRKQTLCEISDRPWRKYVTIPLRLIRHRLFVDVYALPPVLFLRRFVRTYICPRQGNGACLENTQ